jgi:SPP1 family predicted phage head-tail adaptor
MMPCKKKNRYGLLTPVNVKDFKHSISFISLTAGASDGMGGTATNEATFYTTMAAIWPMSGKENVENMRNELKITHKIRIWYKSGITPAMEILFGTRQFEIVSIINKDEANVTLDFLSLERI